MTDTPYDIIDEQIQIFSNINNQNSQEYKIEDIYFINSIRNRNNLEYQNLKTALIQPINQDFEKKSTQNDIKSETAKFQKLRSRQMRNNQKQKLTYYQDEIKDMLQQINQINQTVKELFITLELLEKL